MSKEIENEERRSKGLDKSFQWLDIPRDVRQKRRKRAVIRRIRRLPD